MSDAQTVDDVIANEGDQPSKKLEVSDSELEKIRKDLERERRTSEMHKNVADEAKRQRTELSSKLAVETTNRTQAEEVAITNAIAASVAEAERLEQEIVSAQENGKFADAAKLTRQLASAQTKIDSWESRKVQLENWKEQQKNVKPVQEQPEYPRSKAWIAAHPQFNSDEKFRNKVMAAHYQAQSEGLVIDSDEYIDYIDNSIAGKKQHVEVVNDDGDVVVTAKQTHKTAAATPPSRNVGNMSSNTGQRDTNNRLSPEEAEMAILTYGPNSALKLKPAEAQKRYMEAKNMLIDKRIIQGNA